MATFRLVHLSDLHFSATPNRVNPLIGASGARAPDLALWRHFLSNVTLLGPSSYSSNMATLLGDYLESIEDTIDAIVVTGDLATTGSEGDLNSAKQFFLPPSPNRIRAIPQLNVTSPQIFLPGNHDRYQGKACLPGGSNFEKVFGTDWDAGQGIVYKSEGKVRAFVLEKEGDRLGICNVDFSLETRGDSVGRVQPGWFGQGRVYPGALNDLEKVTQGLRKELENIYVIWAMHFPPDLPESSEQLKLIEGHLVSPLAHRCNVDLILCGHMHNSSAYSIGPASSVRVLCAGSATSVDVSSEHALFELEINTSRGKLRSRLVQKTCYDESLGVFRVSGLA